MASFDPLTVDLKNELSGQLNRLAGQLGRSREWLIQRALEEFTIAHGWQIEAAREGIDEVGRGEVVPHAEVEDWVESWGTGRELPRP